jgi:hypothetical protein
VWLIGDLSYPDQWLVESDVEVMAMLTLWALDVASERCASFADLAPAEEKLAHARAVVADEVHPAKRWLHGVDWPRDEPDPDSPELAQALTVLALHSAHEVWAQRNGLTFGYFEEGPKGTEVEVEGSWDPVAEFRLPNGHPGRPLAIALDVHRDTLGRSEADVVRMSERAIWGTDDESLVALGRDMWRTFEGSFSELRTSIERAAT